MTKIDKHIIDLLHDNECVIVPRMGGFVNLHSGEDARPSQHPDPSHSKRIAFNTVLTYNDGLLANYIAQREQLTYKEALQEIEEYVHEFHEMLASGKKFVIEEVGILKKDTEGNVQFEPLHNANYIKESIKEPDAEYYIESDNEIIPEAENEPEETVAPPRSKPQPRKPKTSNNNKSNRIFTLLLWASVLWLCFCVYILSPVKLNFTWLNSYFHKTSERPFDKNVPTLKSESPAPPSAPSPAPVEDAIIKLADDARSALRASSAAPEDDASASSKVKFFIVAGSFKSVDNAKRKLDELKSQGYGHAQILEGKGSIKLVCYDGFRTLNEANEKMKSTEMKNKQAWIYNQ